MKNSSEDLAIFGKEPLFKEVLPVGQLNFPSWSRFEKSFRGIFERRYYTNHGPLAQELEQHLSRLLAVKHVVCVTNATIGLMIAIKAMGLKGRVITPAFTFAATVQSITWAGLDVIFCDVDKNSHCLTAEKIAPLLDSSVSAVLSVHLWGNPSDVDGIEKLAGENNLKVLYDAAHAFGARYSGVGAANFGNLSVFSFHATKVLNGAEGGCICTNDDDLAARLRNIRSSYGSGPAVDIPLTGNGRMSEAQAAMALLSLEDYPDNLNRNQRFFALYERLLSDLPGIRLVPPPKDVDSNFQYIVVEIESSEFGISRDQLVRLLKAENVHARRYFSPGLHRCVPYRDMGPETNKDNLPVTDFLSERVMQLPSGEAMSEDKVQSVCQLIRLAHENAEKVSAALR